MAGKITNFFRETQLFFSIILTILGIIILFLGLAGIWYQDFLMDVFGFPTEFLSWSLYLLIAGFIVFLAGVWYLYTFLKNRKFIFDELDTNKRSELIKKHVELKNAVKHMPSKYQKMLKEKEDELFVK
jgi:ABC-type multidrug transport system fused ATPase/permease subunit